MTWLPLVTFSQVTQDMPVVADVPEGHGHRYTGESVDAWATLLRPPDWTPDKADRLRTLIREWGCLESRRAQINSEKGATRAVT